MNLGFSIVVYIYYKHQFRCNIYDFFSHDPLQASKSTLPFICHLYLKSVDKIPSNFWKENLPFKRTHSHAFGPQKTLNRYTYDKKKIIKRASIIQKLSILFGYCFTDQGLLHSFGFLLVDLFATNFPQHTFYYYIYILKLTTNIINKIIQ